VELLTAADDLCDFYRGLANRGELFGFEAAERFFEIGNPPSLAETGEFLALHARRSTQGPPDPS
jgi:hypothetical protein